MWQVFHSVTLAKKSILPEFPQTLDEFPEEQGLHLVVLDSPPHQKTASESPMVHTPKTKRATYKIEPEKQALDSPSHGMTGFKGEEPITVDLKDCQIVHSLKELAQYHHRPGTPYRKVDLPGKEIETLEAGILDKTDDSFEIDSESERTLTEEPKEPEEPKTPKSQINRGETAEGITKRKLVPVVLPFDSNIGKGLKLKTGTKPRPKVNSEKGPEKQVEATEKPHKKPRKETVEVLLAPIVSSPSKTPSVSPVSTPSSHSSTPPSPTPSSPLSPVLVGPVAMGTVEEIKNALIESNRVAAMPIPQFYRKKGEKPEDHIMKVEDYFQNYNIRDTCCGKARTWLSTLTEYPKIFDPEEAPDEAAKAKTMKAMFLARWQLKGRTPQMLYMEWQI